MNMNKGKDLIFGVDSSIFLLLSVFAFVFIFPIIDNGVIHDFFITLSYSLVLLSIFSIVESKTRKFSYLIIIAVISNILMYFSDNEFVRTFTFSLSALTFIIATGILINHISSSKNVTLSVVIQAISGYLLIGIIGVLLNAILLSFNNEALQFSSVGSKFSSVIYYSFITLTTIGYGEILPQTVTARSISIFIGVSGQIYLTVVIAMIIGKFLSANLKK